MPLKGDRKRFSIRLNKGSQATMGILEVAGGSLVLGFQRRETLLKIGEAPCPQVINSEKVEERVYTQTLTACMEDRCKRLRVSVGYPEHQ